MATILHIEHVVDLADNSVKSTHFLPHFAHCEVIDSQLLVGKGLAPVLETEI